MTSFFRLVFQTSKEMKTTHNFDRGRRTSISMKTYRNNSKKNFNDNLRIRFSIVPKQSPI